MQLSEQQLAELERRGWWLVEEPAYGQRPEEAPLAICLAALRAVGVEVPTER